MGVAPRAREASSYSLGTASSAVRDIFTMLGKIMTESTTMAEKRLAPSERPNSSRTPGTSTIMPTRP